MKYLVIWMEWDNFALENRGREPLCERLSLFSTDEEAIY